MILYTRFILKETSEGDLVQERILLDLICGVMLIIRYIYIMTALYTMDEFSIVVTLEDAVTHAARTGLEVKWDLLVADTH